MTTRIFAPRLLFLSDDPTVIGAQLNGAALSLSQAGHIVSFAELLTRHG
jgi:hypothetical protein